MAFHRSRYGKYGEDLPGDLNGDVPEVGDHWEDFAWPAHESRRFSESPRQWDTFVDRAVQQTATAAAALEADPAEKVRAQG